MSALAALVPFGTSLLHALAWWATGVMLASLGWLVLRPALRDWQDEGWALARPLTTTAFAYAIFVVSHLVPAFRAPVLWAIVLAAVSVIIIRRPTAFAIDRATLWKLLAAEARFALPFAFYVAIRGFSHDVIGLEKFMDFAFVASAVGSATTPIADPWFAGKPINYYYFGHFVAAFLCKLSGTPTAYGYNLMLATIFATTFQLAYALVAELTRRLAAPVGKTLALVAGVWLTVGGNVHGFLYGFVKPWLVSLDVVPPLRQAFLLSDPTRFVGHDPLTGDKLIHEFPAYAFYVGDLHAHLVNLPNVLLLLGVLLLWFRARSPQVAAADPVPGHGGAAGEGGGLTPAGVTGTLGGVTRGHGRRAWLLVAAWLIGTFAMANSWDALMYGALLGIVVFAHGVDALRHGLRAIWSAVVDGISVALVTAATAAPFLLHFRTGGSAFLPTHSHTPAWQWLVLYGLQGGLALAGCVLVFRGRGKLPGEPERQVRVRSPEQLLLVGPPERPLLVGPPERLLLLVLTTFGLAFALVPEFVYLKDIYGADHYRANTAFKFGFQAFTLLTLAACVGIATLLSVRPSWLPRVAVIVVAELLLVPPLYYGWFVLQGGFGVWREREWTLDGQRYLALSHPEDRAVVAWMLAQDGRRGPLVESPGDSYTFGARISANTGIPAVLGWPVHEQLWRASDPIVWRRRDDVQRIYETKSAAEAMEILGRYRPRWLVVGRFERERYPELDPVMLAGLGRVAFRSGETFVVEFDWPPRNQ